MLRPRIIPCLLVSNKGLVKTVKFSKPKYVGDPINAVKIFNEKEVDELVCISSQGNAIRLNLNEIPVMGKAAFGVRIVNIVKPDVIVGMARLVKEDEDEDENQENTDNEKEDKKSEEKK